MILSALPPENWVLAPLVTGGDLRGLDEVLLRAKAIELMGWPLAGDSDEDGSPDRPIVAGETVTVRYPCGDVQVFDGIAATGDHGSYWNERIFEPLEFVGDALAFALRPGYQAMLILDADPAAKAWAIPAPGPAPYAFRTVPLASFRPLQEELSVTCERDVATMLTCASLLAAGVDLRSES